MSNENIVINCPSCETSYQVSSSNLGKKLKCYQCKHIWIIAEQQNSRVEEDISSENNIDENIEQEESKNQDIIKSENILTPINAQNDLEKVVKAIGNLNNIPNNNLDNHKNEKKLDNLEKELASTTRPKNFVQKFEVEAKKDEHDIIEEKVEQSPSLIIYKFSLCLNVAILLIITLINFQPIIENNFPLTQNIYHSLNLYSSVNLKYNNVSIKLYGKERKAVKLICTLENNNNFDYNNIIINLVIKQNNNITKIPMKIYSIKKHEELTITKEFMNLSINPDAKFSLEFLDIYGNLQSKFNKYIDALLVDI